MRDSGEPVPVGIHADDIDGPGFDRTSGKPLRGCDRPDENGVQA
jgi:hypothetical protein